MKKHFSLRILLTISLSVLAFGFFVFKGWAQLTESVQTLAVSPASQEVNADPGTIKTVKATVTNRSSQNLPISLRVEDFTASGEEGQVALVEGSKYSVKTWTTISPKSFDLAPGGTQEV